jgi:predicted O-methyltransferase YrrM
VRAGPLREARAQAWQICEPLQAKLSLSMKVTPGNRLARFVRNILTADLPRPVRYLEIGSFEGGSLALIHTLLRGEMRATAIDPFSHYPELAATDWISTEARFDANTEKIGAAGAVRKLRGRSIDHLPRLIDAGEKFDLIFIDGSHHMLDVMVDAALAWRLLARPGLMIFDDYWFDEIHGGERYRPRPAIDAFIGMMAREIDVVDMGGQVFIRPK